MIYDFEVKSVKCHHNRGDFIFARHLGHKHDFNIPEGSLFGDISVYHYSEIRRLKDEDGTEHPDIFVFRPTSMEWLKDNHFSEGQKVKLQINNETKSL